MFDSYSFVVFSAAALMLLLTPGPAVLYIAARSVEQGVRAGLVASLGACTGGVVHVVAATVGLSALLVSSATAFSVVKFAGAGYLIYLGIRTVASGRAIESLAPQEAKPLRRIFRESVVVQVLNPKMALFFFAFLPQFVDPARGSAMAQVLVLGMAFVAMALVTDSAYALFAGRFATWLRSTVRVMKAQRYVAGSVYIALGLVTAASGSGRK